MKQPCKYCPFLTQLGGMLHRERAREIADVLLNDAGFFCHETLDYSRDADHRITDDSKLCTGAMIFLEHVAPGGCRANIQFRLAIMSGYFQLSDLRKDPKVCSSIEQFMGADECT